MEKKKKAGSTLDELIAKQTTTTADAISAAAAKYAARQEEAQSEKIIQNLGIIDQAMSGQVDELRRLRAAEKAQGKKVLALEEAKQQYLQDADWDKFNESLS